MLSLEYSHEQTRLLQVLSTVPKDAVIADIGCGRGRNLDLLREHGYTKIVGVDINPELREIAERSGHRCLSPEKFSETYGTDRVDALLMSHIVEHFSHVNLLEFLEEYLSFLKPGGQLIVVTPLMSDAFYNDFDHVRPYLPQGFGMVFAPEVEQVQYQSKCVLATREISFYRAPFRLQWHGSFYVEGGSTLPNWINRIYRLAFLLSAGVIGYTAGWIGRFEYQGRRKVSGSQYP